MDKLEWCLKQKKGIKVIESNENLSKEYIESSDENLQIMQKVRGKWKTIIAYYTCYDCISAVLQKAGIQCEIHDCSIELLGFFGLDQDQIKFIKELKKKRIDAQYYLRKPKEVNSDKVKEFISSCKLSITKLSQDKIEKIKEIIVK